MLIIVTGSQTWSGVDRLWRALDEAYQLALRAGERLVVVHGKAPKGADLFTAKWVEWQERWDCQVDEHAHPAQWWRFGRAAGIHRNQQLWTEYWHRTDLCIAFRSTGPSPGTDDCIARAEQHDCPVWRIPPDPDPIPPMPRFRLNP